MKLLISHVLQQELNDPRVGFVTVLEVEPTGDLKEATVRLSILGQRGDRVKAERAIEDARGFIQREVGKGLETRNTPVLRFVFDQSSDRVSRLESLLDESSREDRESNDA